ncbi:hypothetical protein K1719_026951 [Acacia pycnantha]|nr:hypothetical protein K1719_026951 [Acacia pycnantha]
MSSWHVQAVLGWFPGWLGAEQPALSHGYKLFTFQVISEIIDTCRAHDFTDVILVHEHRGVLDGLIISHLPLGLTAYFGLFNVVARHDIKDRKAIGTIPEVYPHLILDNFSTKLGQRTANILKHLLPMPKPDTKRIITFSNQSDYISFSTHSFKLFQIKLGTVDHQDTAQTEWVIRPYMRPARKQKFLGD